MNNPSGPGKFIPYRISDVVEMCIQDGKLNADEQEKFRTFCRILVAYYHYIFHERLTKLKDFFIPTDPDSQYKTFRKRDDLDDPEKVRAFFDNFEYLLQKANYRKLTEEEIKASFEDKTLIELNYFIDFDELDHYVIYYRGRRRTSARVKVLPLVYREREFDVYDRVIIMLKFKDREFFEARKVNVDKLDYRPGSTYLYYYKNIPVNDIEILFPNVQIRMTLRDQLLFWVPAIGAGISSLWKVLSNILILIGFILFLIGLEELAQRLDIPITDEILEQSIYPLLISISSIIMVLGGFAIKQYMNYKNKFIRFMKTITDTLFFRSISINVGVFQTLVDSAEEEECEEAILAYYHLLTSEKTLTKKELDHKIEAWFRDNFDTHLNFDVEDALKKLRRFIPTRDDCSGTPVEHTGLIRLDEDGKFGVRPLDEAIYILDNIWDDIFFCDKPSEAFQE